MASDFLYCEATDTRIYANDVITIAAYPGIKWIVKHAWYKFGGAQKNGWYVLSIKDKTILPIDQIDLTTIAKDMKQGTSELRPTLQDMDAPPAESNFIVIPGTNIRLYDSDIVIISTKPNVKWIVHLGWFIYDGVQNYNWYFVSIKDGEILPASVIDLTLCTLVTSKTQGSIRYDGKVVNYTRPFTEADAEILNRAFITVDTIAQRDNLDKNLLIDGKMVRVNDIGAGFPGYFIWDAELKIWERVLDFGGIPLVIGTLENPLILSTLPEGLYRVLGTYLVSPTSDTSITTEIDHLTFVSGDSEHVAIKVLTEDSITDYIVESDYVTLVTQYATKPYVDGQIALLEIQISYILGELAKTIKKSNDPDATFEEGQWAVFDSEGNLKGLDNTASNIPYDPPASGPSSVTTNVQTAIDAINAAVAGGVQYDTEENWNAQPQLTAAKGVIYVYSNHDISAEDRFIPGIKIGDGVSYLIDMPFIDNKYAIHIADTIIHVSTDDREFWGDKVTCDIDPIKDNVLVFTKN